DKLGRSPGKHAASIAHVSNYRHGIQRIPRAVFNLEVPTVAAVNGAAVGAGCDLAMMCDIRLAGPHAKFAESFVKLGIIPGDGGAWFLPRVVGWQRAAQMLFTGEMIDAPTALEWGMVTAVSDTVVEDAQALAAQIATNPPEALRSSKKLLREAQHVTLDQALESAARLQAIAHHTPEHSEALEQFLNARSGR
ncbi:MAG: enoyl-CoA hydratase-related protein, partial [Myxococcota bacterium]